MVVLGEEDDGDDDDDAAAGDDVRYTPLHCLIYIYSSQSPLPNDRLSQHLPPIAALAPLIYR